MRWCLRCESGGNMDKHGLVLQELKDSWCEAMVIYIVWWFLVFSWDCPKWINLCSPFNCDFDGTDEDDQPGNFITCPWRWKVCRRSSQMKTRRTRIWLKMFILCLFSPSQCWLIHHETWEYRLLVCVCVCLSVCVSLCVLLPIFGALRSATPPGWRSSGRWGCGDPWTHWTFRSSPGAGGGCGSRFPSADRGGRLSLLPLPEVLTQHAAAPHAAAGIHLLRRCPMRLLQDWVVGWSRWRGGPTICWVLSLQKLLVWPVPTVCVQGDEGGVVGWGLEHDTWVFLQPVPRLYLWTNVP